MLLFIQFLSSLVFILLSVAFFSLFERKLMGLIQVRKGPNKVFLLGFLQPIADAMKLISKMEIFPISSIFFMYFISPLFIFFLSLMIWILYPYFFSKMMKFSSIILLIFFSLSVYGLIMSGWFSNSKYTFIGGSRALAQSISYEVGLTMILIFLYIFMASTNLMNFMLFQFESVSFFFMNILLLLLLVMTLLAELNRSPFDLAEGESELVSGYSVEYGGLSYTLIFLGENLSIMWMSILISLLFLWESVSFFIYLIVWIRATLPRIRFDKLMSLFWISLLPLILLSITLLLSVI